MKAIGVCAVKSKWACCAVCTVPRTVPRRARTESSLQKMVIMRCVFLFSSFLAVAGFRRAFVTIRRRSLPASKTIYIDPPP